MVAGLFKSPNFTVFSIYYDKPLGILLIQLARCAQLWIIAMINQRLYDLLLMLMSEGFHCNGKLYCAVTVDADKLVMVQTDYIALGLRNN
jgi:hypothetical protein